jgi:hypothetical protein
MTGLLSILLLMLLPQAGILPGQTGPGQVVPGQMGIVPGVSSTQPTSGWEVDQRSQKFTFIIQIPPNAVDAFAQGPTGNELPVPIEDRLVGKVEQIAIRFDTKDLPRIDPPNLSSRSQASVQPSIQNLALMRYAPQTQPGSNQWENIVGWQFDTKSSRYAYVIQIPVASLEQFMTGPNGQEMIVPVHPDVMGFVEQVTVRIGSGALPKETAPASVLAKYQTTQNDSIRNLAGGTNYGAPISIDPTPVSGGGELGQLRGGQGAVLPNLPNNSTSFATGSDTGMNRIGAGTGLAGNNMPSMPNYNNTSNPGYTNTNNGSVVPQGYRTPSTSETPSLDAARRASEKDLIPAQQNRIAGNIFGQSDAMRPNPVTDRFASNTDVRNFAAGQGLPAGQYGQGYVNPQNQYVNTLNPAYAQMASNTMQPFAPQGFGNTPTSGVPGTIPNNQITPVSLQGGTALQGQTAGNLTQQGAQPPPDRKIGFNWALAALVLLGFNIYQFFWMSNARVKYRQMVMSKRSTRLEPTA